MLYVLLIRGKFLLWVVMLPVFWFQAVKSVVKRFVQLLLHHRVDPRGEEFLQYHIQARCPDQVGWEAAPPHTTHHPRSTSGAEEDLQVRRAQGQRSGQPEEVHL